MTTLTSITTQQIQQLRTEAASAGDLAQVRICDRALRGSMRATRICVQVISAAEAQ